MLIATIGLAVVVARNVAESRAELALLRAVGFGRPALLAMVLAEHLPPVGFGLVAGVGASAAAVCPTALQQGTSLAGLAVPIGAIIASASLCVAISAVISLRADLLPALREE
jgi:ABC-type antimicrobial peptide transport system permease subunit